MKPKENNGIHQFIIAYYKVESVNQYSDTSQNIGFNFLTFQPISMRLGM